MIRLFFSGTPSLTALQKTTLGSMITRRLNSCHDDYLREAMLWGGIISREESVITEWMLDSGAFTAWSRGDVVTLNGVIERYERALNTMTKSSVKTWLINLDIIPGSRGVDPTMQQIEEAQHQSDENFEILKKRFGDCILPVFHQGEGSDRLNELRKQANYIGVSPRNDLPEKVRVEWSVQAHKLLGETRSHGLAATGDNMVRNVPWWSVDSASWLYTAAMGGIDILLDKKLGKISLSDRSPNLKFMGQHFDNMPEAHKEIVVARIEQMGLDLNKLKTTANERVFFCAIENQRWGDDGGYENKLKAETLFPL